MLGTRDQLEQDLLRVEEELQDLREEMETFSPNDRTIYYTIMDLSKDLMKLAIAFDKDTNPKKEKY